MNIALNSIDKFDDYFLKVTKGEIYYTVIRHVEKILIEKALKRSSGNQIAAAKMLGINRNTLRTKIKKLGIKVEKWKL